MRRKVDLEPETELSDNVYLGCNQRVAEPNQQLLHEKNRLFKKLTTHEKVEAEGDLSVPEEDQKPKRGKKNSEAAGDHGYPQECLVHTKAWNYDMIGHAEQCVQRWCELAKKETKDLPIVGTPCIDDHDLRPEDLVAQGTLADVCSRIVLKCLYLARIGRPDLLYSVNILARSVTKWNRACDRRLERLIAYIHKTKDYVQHCFVGDSSDNCKIGLFCDASFAADLSDSKSTTGGLLCVFGPSTFVPITWVCKKHGAVSHSSTEAEVIALDAALRMEGLPALMLWDVITECLYRAGGDPKRIKAGGDPRQSGNTAKPHQTHAGERVAPEPSDMAKYDVLVSSLVRDVDFVPPSMRLSSGVAKLFVFEDNEAVIKMCIKGRSPNLRHIARTHRVDLDWLIERIKVDPGINLKYVGTNEQMADLLTKASFTIAKWNSLLRLHQIGIFGGGSKPGQNHTGPGHKNRPNNKGQRPTREA